MVPEDHVRCYTVCHMVPETRVKTCSYQVCHMVPETHVKTCSYQVCHMVSECKSVAVPYKCCHMVEETCVKQVPYTICKPVHYTKTIQCEHCVPKQVAYTVTRCVPKVVCMEVPVQVCCPCPCEPTCEGAKPSLRLQQLTLPETVRLPLAWKRVKSGPKEALRRPESLRWAADFFAHWPCLAAFQIEAGQAGDDEHVRGDFQPEFRVRVVAGGDRFFTAFGLGNKTRYRPKLAPCFPAMLIEATPWAFVVPFASCTLGPRNFSGSKSHWLPAAAGHRAGSRRRHSPRPLSISATRRFDWRSCRPSPCHRRRCRNALARLSSAALVQFGAEIAPS